MKKSPWRLALAALLFACWIGYLAYLSFATTEPIVLSRPQFLGADLYVIATIPADAAKSDEPGSEVTVKKMVWAANPIDQGFKTLKVVGLPSRTELEAERKGAEVKEPEKKWVWDGPGDYILALKRSPMDPNVFFVAPLPKTPGYQGYFEYRIYPATPTTLRQLELLTQEYHPGK